MWLALLEHAKGLLALARDNEADAAERHFAKAIDLAQAQDHKLWELRAATSLGRLWYSQGKSDEARDLLSRVYGWFDDGFDTTYLKEAKALLEELK